MREVKSEREAGFELEKSQLAIRVSKSVFAWFKSLRPHPLCGRFIIHMWKITDELMKALPFATAKNNKKEIVLSV